MKLLYLAGIYAYSLFIKAATYFNPKAHLFVKGRKNWQKTLAAKIETNARYIWIHCASLGEFEQGRPLIEAIRNHLPEYRIVLTFFSPSGYEVRKNYDQADVVSYLPLDTIKNARTFLRMVQPEKAFFIKYEYWYFYINELRKKGIPLYIVSAIFRDDQQFFKDSSWGKWYRQMLHKTTHFFIQDEKSARLLQSIGIENYTITGDTRFDRVAAIAKSAREIPIIEKFRGNKTLLIAGSTWKQDEELLASYLNKHKNLKLIIAPHEVNQINLTRLETLFNEAVLLSKADDEISDTCQVLIIDSIGMLSSLYRYGHIAYIGGGFGAGIHNILEAATFGLPVLFGPNYQKFREAVDLKKLGGAFPVAEYNSLEKTLLRLANNPSKREEASQLCRNYIAQNIGATNKILQEVFNI